jgi:hypothetical protein
VKRLQVLFLLALVGVLVCVGLGLLALAGAVPALVFAVVALVLLAGGAARARAATAAAERAAAGRSCTCCTTSQHDPVKVI